MLNRWIASGRVEYNPTLRETFLKDKSAVHISSFTLLIDRGHDNCVDRIKCSCFGKMADYAYNYIKAGDIVYVEGQLQAYTSNNDGKSKLSVPVRDIELIYRSENSKEYDNFEDIKNKMLIAFPDDSNETPKRKSKRDRKRQKGELPLGEDSAETDTTSQDLDGEVVLNETKTKTETQEEAETDPGIKNLIPF